MALNLKVLRTCKFDRLQPCGIAFMLINSCGEKKRDAGLDLQSKNTVESVFSSLRQSRGEPMLYPPASASNDLLKTKYNGV